MIRITWIYILEVVLPAVIVLVGALALERFLTKKISEYGEEKKVPKTNIHAVKVIVRWTIVIALILIEVTILGIGIGRLWLVVSSIAAMIIIGFVALWSVLGNILAGLVLMMWRPFHIDDRVTILPENISGRAIDINLFFTKIEDDDGDTVSIPNTQVMQKFLKVRSEQSGKGEE